MTKYYYKFWVPFVANKKRILIFEHETNKKHHLLDAGMPTPAFFFALSYYL
ncbi:MAG: hypothetical protein ACYSO7_03200 [Planctomycetota bacterium]|jgi:hypothetical protein